MQRESPGPVPPPWALLWGRRKTEACAPSGVCAYLSCACRALSLCRAPKPGKPSPPVWGGAQSTGVAEWGSSFRDEQDPGSCWDDRSPTALG